MLLLLPIKKYAEGPVKIRERSVLRTRKVSTLYAGRPNTSTRKVFGFYRFPSAFVGKSKPRRIAAYAEGPTRSHSASCRDQGRRLHAYAEGPKYAHCVRGGSAGAVRGRSNSKCASVRGRSASAHLDARVFAFTVYAEGPASFLLIGISPPEGFCTRKVRETSHPGTVTNLILYAEGPR